MKKILLAAALAALAVPAFAQLAPGNYTLNGQTFTVQANGSITGQPGAFIIPPEAGCSGTHVHGIFFGAADPAGGGCGHGIPTFLGGGAGALPGGLSLLPGQVPNSAAGTFALTRSMRRNNAAFIADTGSISGFTLIEGGCDTDFGCAPAASDPSWLNLSDPSWPNVMLQILDLNGIRSDGMRDASRARIEPMHISGTGGPIVDATLGASPSEEWNRRQTFIALEDLNTMCCGTPIMTAEQLAKWPELLISGLRDGPPKPPPAAAANPPAQDAKLQPTKPEPPRESILDEIGEPTLGEMFGGPAPGSKPPAPKPAAAEAPDPEREKFLDKAAQDIADALFSGNQDKGKAAATTLGNAPKDLQNRVVQRINERIQRIVNDAMRAATNAAAGVPRVSN